MIYDVTYPNPETKRRITETLGKPYSFLERIRMKGVGSGKLKIISGSPEINRRININQDTKYAHLEIRRSGIIIGFSAGLRVFQWVIPYYRLSLYKNGLQISIHGEGHHIKLKPAFGSTWPKDFLKRILIQLAKERRDPI